MQELFPNECKQGTSHEHTRNVPSPSKAAETQPKPPVRDQFLPTKRNNRLCHPRKGSIFKKGEEKTFHRRSSAQKEQLKNSSEQANLHRQMENRTGPQRCSSYPSTEEVRGITTTMYKTPKDKKHAPRCCVLFYPVLTSFPFQLAAAERTNRYYRHCL